MLKQPPNTRLVSLEIKSPNPSEPRHILCGDIESLHFLEDLVRQFCCFVRVAHCVPTGIQSPARGRGPLGVMASGWRGTPFSISAEEFVGPASYRCILDCRTYNRSPYLMKRP